MYRGTLFALALALGPAIATADEQTVPIWCCPEFCETADDSAALLPRPGTSGGYDLLLNGTRVPVMPNAFQGTSADSPMQYCVGYDAFGDRQIKCLIT